MKEPTARLRLFAGPNGSGKSTLVYALKNKYSMGHYLNADDILVRLSHQPFIHLSDFNLELTQNDLDNFLEKDSSFIVKLSHSVPIEQIRIDRNILVLGDIVPNSYITALIVEFLRTKLLSTHQSMSFESVMSHPSKIEFLEQARKAEYKTYLYFIATNNVLINISRVKARVRKGGHGVPENKIRERYERAIELLPSAIQASDRAYIFDNTSSQMKWIAEFTSGSLKELKIDEVPNWFSDRVLTKFG